jgi:hypothetical protein
MIFGERFPVLCFLIQSVVRVGVHLWPKSVSTVMEFL